MRAKNHQPIDREHHRQIGTDHDTHIAHFVRHEKGNLHINYFVRLIGTVHDSHIAQFFAHEMGSKGSGA